MNESSDKHFHMSEEYERNSSSQKTIGGAVIESLAGLAKSNFNDSEELSIVDLACGPGNLTIELKKTLEEAVPNTVINLSGLDYSADNVARLEKNSKGEIQGITGSFYDMPLEPESMDMITSNEGLHWQPPHEMSEIIYSQLPAEEKEKYEAWALENFRLALKNIYKTLKEGGIAVLQFGHEGQLQKIWDIVRDTLNEKQFQKYKNKVNFPLYYPTQENINKALLEAGFSDKNIDVKAFSQELTEDTPESINGFLQAFSKLGFSQFMDPDDLKAFYERIQEKLDGMDLDEFRKDQWHRTLIKLKK